MSYNTWDWDEIGYPSDFLVVPVTSTIMSDSEAGYEYSRPRWTRDRLEFQMVWERGRGPMDPGNYMALLDFFWGQRGPALPFYFQMPFGQAGTPPLAGMADPEGTEPFSTELEVGAGEGSIHLVRFTQERLPFRFYFPHWYTESPVILKEIS